MPEISAMNFPSNSNKEREKKDAPDVKKVEKVIKGEAVQRKKPVGRRIIESFTGEDMQSVGSYLLFDVLIPAAKTMIMDAASQGVERMLFGDVRPRSSGSRVGYTNYNRMSSPSRTTTSFREESRSMTRGARSSHNFDEIVIETRGEAEHVIDRLIDLIDKYDVATVSDLYGMVGITGSFVDDKYGWTDRHGFTIRRVREGHLLDLPRPEPID